jgi:uncharacterized protein (DUF4213/DUF364 family)
MRMRASKARSLGRDVGSKGTACISVTLFNVVSYYVSEELEKKLDIDLTISLSIRVWKRELLVHACQAISQTKKGSGDTCLCF